MPDTDRFDLQRFMTAQAPVYDRVVRELCSGSKQSHWMWFIFPQIAGLGSSSTARKYAIGSKEEAVAYLRHEILGARLRECTRLVVEIQGKSAHQIFGSPDDMKFRSCLTLFLAASPGESTLQQALDKYYDGQPDVRTLRLLGQ